MRKVSSRLPNWAIKPFRYTKSYVENLPYYGQGRFCPICGESSRQFKQFGVVPRADAQCVHCGSLERHRLSWLFIKQKTDLFDGSPKKMLHVAPEPVFESKFAEQLGTNYLTADLFNPRAMLKMDITDIQYSDQSFDVIYCSHVLEHVLDDRQAIREFFRVLKNTGWAILLVPIESDQTFEDPSITDPTERLRVFGLEDHVRNYGPDYIERLREAGFTVQVTKVSDIVNSEEVIKMGLTPASGEIYYCTKEI